MHPTHPLLLLLTLTPLALALPTATPNADAARITAPRPDSLYKPDDALYKPRDALRNPIFKPLYEPKKRAEDLTQSEHYERDGIYGYGGTKRSPLASRSSRGWTALDEPKKRAEDLAQSEHYERDGIYGYGGQ